MLEYFLIGKPFFLLLLLLNSCINAVSFRTLEVKSAVSAEALLNLGTFCIVAGTLRCIRGIGIAVWK